MKERLIAFFEKLDTLQEESRCSAAHDYFLMQVGAQEVLKVIDIYVYIDTDGNYQVTDKETFVHSADVL